MTSDDVQAWLDAYVQAWRSNEEAAIRELFARDATYAFHPYEEPVRGSDAIVAAWRQEPDDPASSSRTSSSWSSTPTDAARASWSGTSSIRLRRRRQAQRLAMPG